jgi:hypothetical protein
MNGNQKLSLKTHPVAAGVKRVSSVVVLVVAVEVVVVKVVVVAVAAGMVVISSRTRSISSGRSSTGERSEAG